MVFTINLVDKQKPQTILQDVGLIETNEAIMNLKPTSINPTVTHRVQRFGFIKAVALSGLFTTGALPLAYNPQFTEYKLPTSIHAPAQNAVAAMAIKPDTGSAVIRFEGYTLDVSFQYIAVDDDYGVPGSEFKNAEIVQLNVDQVLDSNNNIARDFTDFNDHLHINQMLVAHMLKNQLLEGV